MEQHSEYFLRFALNPSLLTLVAALVNGKPVLMGVELFAKPPRVGSGVPYHQDNGYFSLVPPDALTCWIAIDQSSPENGCVYYVPGSYRQGPLPHKAMGVPGNSWGLAGPPDPSTMIEVAGLLAPGECTIAVCYTGANRISASDRVVSFFLSTARNIARLIRWACRTTWRRPERSRPARRRRWQPGM
jgi:hypothetical protein